MGSLRWVGMPLPPVRPLPLNSLIRTAVMERVMLTIYGDGTLHSQQRFDKRNPEISKKEFLNPVSPAN